MPEPVPATLTDIYNKLTEIHAAMLVVEEYLRRIDTTTGHIGIGTGALPLEDHGQWPVTPPPAE